jgi:hypothetical protein
MAHLAMFDAVNSIERNYCPRSGWDREFESTSLQRRVCCEPVFLQENPHAARVGLISRGRLTRWASAPDTWLLLRPKFGSDRLQGLNATSSPRWASSSSTSR